MSRYCPNPECNAVEGDDKALACRKCGTLFSSKPDEAYRRIRNRLIGDASKLLTMLGILIGGSVLGVLVWIWGDARRHASRYMDQKIAEQFKDERILSTVERVVASNATDILVKEVRPEVVKFKEEIGVQVNGFSNYLSELRQDYTVQYVALSNEVFTLEKRNHVTSLADRSIQNADRKAYDELVKLAGSSDSPDIAVAANAERARVIAFWTSMSRADKRSVSAKYPDGSIKTNQELHTSLLAAGVKQSPDWAVRAVAAKLLGDRKEKGVPEALLYCIDNDGNMEAARNAARSFNEVTGDDISPLYFETYDGWWASHTNELSAKLKDQPPLPKEFQTPYFSAPNIKGQILDSVPPFPIDPAAKPRIE
jgi:hypothetical protein